MWNDIQTLEIICRDALKELQNMDTNSIDCCITSPPYWGLRDYGTNGQLGLEATPEEYIEKLVEICKEIRRVLKCGGTFWLNLGDSYAHSSFGKGDRAKNSPKQLTNNGANFVRNLDFNIQIESKNLLGIPWRVALALQKQRWYLRSDIIWHKPNPMPESCTDRPTKAHEYLFLLTKCERYFYDAEAVREPELNPGASARQIEYQKQHKVERGFKGALVNHSAGWDGDRNSYKGGRNKRTVWTIATQRYLGVHFATFPKKLVEPCILAGTRKGEIVLDPFAGSGTVGEVALEHGRSAILIELNKEYIPLIRRRCSTWTMHKGDRESLWYRVPKVKKVFKDEEK